MKPEPGKPWKGPKKGKRTLSWRLPNDQERELLGWSEEDRRRLAHRAIQKGRGTAQSLAAKLKKDDGEPLTPKELDDEAKEKGWE